MSNGTLVRLSGPLALCLAASLFAGQAFAQPGRFGRRPGPGDEKVSKLEAEVAKLKEQMGRLEASLKKMTAAGGRAGMQAGAWGHGMMRHGFGWRQAGMHRFGWGAHGFHGRHSAAMKRRMSASKAHHAHKEAKGKHGGGAFPKSDTSWQFTRSYPDLTCGFGGSMTSFEFN